MHPVQYFHSFPGQFHSCYHKRRNIPQLIGFRRLPSFQILLVCFVAVFFPLFFTVLLVQVADPSVNTLQPLHGLNRWNPHRPLSTLQIIRIFAPYIAFSQSSFNFIRYHRLVCSDFPTCRMVCSSLKSCIPLVLPGSCAFYLAIHRH